MLIVQFNYNSVNSLINYMYKFYMFFLCVFILKLVIFIIKTSLFQKKILMITITKVSKVVFIQF